MNGVAYQEEVGLEKWRRAVYLEVYVNNLSMVHEGDVKLKKVHT